MPAQLCRGTVTDAPKRPVVRAVFQRRARFLPVDLRRLWRVPLVLLVVNACRGHQATRMQIHVLGWALLRADMRDAIGHIFSTDEPDRSLLRFDPALSRAVDMAVGSGFLRESDTGVLTLTPEGRAIIERIGAEDGPLAVEKQALARLPRRFTQTDAARLLHVGRSA